MRTPAARLRLGLRSVFVLLGLLVLLIAGGGLVLFRVYDNQLIRQTEAELVAQGAALASIYRQALLAGLARQAGPAGGAPAVASYGIEVAPAFRSLHDPRLALRPRPAVLSLGSEPIRPTAEPARPPAEPAEPLALAAGATLDQVLRETKRTTLAGLRIVDFRGTVVASSHLELGQSLAHREEVGRALQGEMVSLFRRRVSDQMPPPYSSLSRETGVRVFVALPVVAENRVLGAVVLSRTPMTLGKAFYQDRYSLLAMAAILVAAVLAVSLLAAALIVRPVRALIRQTQAIAAGEAAGLRALAHAGTREIAQLSQSFADMATRLAQRTEYIKGFAASVSHEFKTPLSAIVATAELLRDHGADMTAEERERFVANLGADAQRLTDLVHRVLELARADMMAPGDVRADVGAVIAEVAKSCRAGGMSVETSGAEAAGQARIDGETLAAILRSLADNARQHGGEDVTLHIVARRSGSPPAVAIDFFDDGPGISEANRARVFEPFFTTARDRGGTGMGLTIARALLRACGGTIELAPTEKGACFRVMIPV
ncbi:MAG: HAMP domain-containing histidine kinase [Deltaproteobacteria bacterium]|nr:HAMP domain-containing histidine kinase [Deltaproteobacteria bacterium]